MKSREVFDPSKPFVFPPVIKSSDNSGCGCLIVGTLIAMVLIGVAGNSKQSGGSPSISPPSTLPQGPFHPLPPENSRPSSGRATTMTEEATPSPASIQLKDVSSFPVMVILSRRIEIKTNSGGFGLDSGDQVLVVRKQNGNYFISHLNQEYEVSEDLIGGAQTK